MNISYTHFFFLIINNERTILLSKGYLNNENAICEVSI